MKNKRRASVTLETILIAVLIVVIIVVLVYPVLKNAITAIMNSMNNEITSILKDAAAITPIADKITPIP